MYQNNFGCFYQLAFKALYPNQELFPGYYLMKLQNISNGVLMET